VAASFRNADPGQEEVARSLGVGRLGTFWRVTLRQIRPAMLGGCLLVTLGLLAEFGAFEIVQYQTFTVAIFTEFKLGFDAVGACVLSLVLVIPLHMGAAGIMVGNFSGTYITYFLLLWARRDMIGLHVNMPVLRQMLHFSLPLMPAGVALWALNLADRVQVQRLTSARELSNTVIAPEPCSG